MPPKLALPGNLLKEMGVSGEPQTHRDSKYKWKSQGQNRKDRRKAERSMKKQKPTMSRQRSNHQRVQPQARQESSDDEDPFDVSDDATPEPPPTKATKTRDNLKKRKRDIEDEDEEESEPEKTKQPTKVAREKLAKDDAEIAALEKKLGIKGRKKLPKVFHEDGLDTLLGEGDDSDSSDEGRRQERAEAAAWLASKRRKATKQKGAPQWADGDSENSDEDEDMFDLDDDLDGFDDGSEDEDDEGDMMDDDDDEDGDSSASDPFGDSDGSEAEEPEAKAPRVRENPYVAPVAASSAPKYIPPSLRKSLGKDADLEAQIRRRTQGPVNRVTEANLISIVGEVEKLYREFPRGVLTDILTDLLMAQICDSTSKPDTLLVLSAGFISALYKIIGIDFAARFLQTVVERFAREHEAAEQAVSNGQTPTKETSNLITVLAEMYMFRVIGSNLLFDYVKLLLGDLTELNAEILLRIVRLAGPQLRKDDPLALKDIVSLIRPAVAKIGEENLTVRTKFMIETISDLKNNKIKAGSQDLAVLNEHVTRMKKLLGSMETAKVKATEPLRIGLQDIQNADKTGKWWLVGASWGGRQNDDKVEAPSKTAAKDDESDDDGVEDVVIADEFDMPDYAALAREQGMNTDVRRAIFIALVAAADVQDAYLRILKLRLNKFNRREIANVLVQCSGAQEHYNPYYTLVASKFCADSRIKYSFQDTLWTSFRRLGEPLFGEEPEEEDDEAAEDRRLINTAKMFGNLVLDSSLGLGILKPLNLAYVKDSTSLFVEVLLITILQGCMKHKTKTLEQQLAKVFVSGLPPDLARSVRYFMRKKVRSSDLVGGKQAKKFQEACKVAETMLDQRERTEEE